MQWALQAAALLLPGGVLLLPLLFRHKAHRLCAPTCCAAAYATAGKPLPADIEACMQWLLNEPLREAFARMLDLQLSKGVALVDILQQLHP